MERVKKKVRYSLNFPGVTLGLINSSDENTVLQYENEFVGMFLSLFMFLGAAVYFYYSFFVQNQSIGHASAFSALFLGIGFLTLIIIRKTKPGLSAHLISLLYAAGFLIFSIGLYGSLGLSVWIMGFVLVLLSMIRTFRPMLIYSGVSLCVSYTLIVHTHYPAGGYADTVNLVIQLILFCLMLFIAIAIHHINILRYREIQKQLHEVNTQIEYRKKAEEKSLKMAFYDPLTGLPNRILFNDRLNQAILMSERDKSEFYILFVDLDFFKMINDSMGHSHGDELLRQAAYRLKNALYKSDTVARFGGDEFVILLQNVTDDLSLHTVTTKLLSNISEPFLINQKEIDISCSIGISKFPDDARDAETLINYADIAMYQAKQGGRNRYAGFTNGLKKTIDYEMNLMNSLKNAIRQDEFSLCYQPQVNSVTGKVIGIEALIRWNHPELGLIYPKEFISLAEKTGLIIPIGEWVIRTACRQNKYWQEKGVACVPVSINLSHKQFNHALVDQVERILRECGLEPGYLELEISEGILTNEFTHIKKELEQLRKIGVRISIDNFGTGYSTVRYLQEFPVDQIKIPLDFIRGIDSNFKDESIITFILTLAQQLNLNVIAEGVETKSQIQFLKKRKCENIQGYYFYKPMHAHEIEERLLSNR